MYTNDNPYCDAAFDAINVTNMMLSSAIFNSHHTYEWSVSSLSRGMYTDNIPYTESCLYIYCPPCVTHPEHYTCH